jgi:ABC-2 type transport system ATP-binding protein
MSLSVQQLTKVYGTQKAVQDLTFSVGRGEIAGFLGPNGAGKSTTMKILTGIISPTSGRALVNDLDVALHPVEVKKMVGYLPEHNPQYTDMYVREYLEFVGRLYGIRGRALRSAVDDMIARCGLGREQHKKIEALSKGYRQRVGLAQALLHQPQVLILDEPTTGLDPNQIIEIRQLIREVSRDKTVLFSTHILQEVEALCDRVLVINQGVLVADDTLKNLKGKFSAHHTLYVAFSQPVEAHLLATLPGVESVTAEGNLAYRLRVRTEADVRPEVFRLAAAAQLTLLEMRQEENTLEELFRNLTQNNPTHEGASA